MTAMWSLWGTFARNMSDLSEMDLTKSNNTHVIRSAAPAVIRVEEVLHVADMVLLPLSDVEELAWQEKALCAQTDPEAFFPEKGGSTREAKKICLSCEVRVECLEYALESDERFGIWGGLSERERRRLKKRAV
jgi:WhiB family transcriptional regulator, redox-sensing transcriptional regulator